MAITVPELHEAYINFPQSNTLLIDAKNEQTYSFNQIN